jgi:hypothetical protein
MSIERIVIAGLIAYRVSRIVIADDGPFDVLANLRARASINKQDTWWRRGLACMACVSFWVGVVSIFVLGERELIGVVSGGLAASTIAILVSRNAKV